MPMRPYPDDRSDIPVQLNMTEFIQESAGYYQEMDLSREHELKFLKFVLAGRRGIELENQDSITLNVLQGQPDIHNLTVTRDYDSLIGTTKTLPYLVALTVWPVPSFRDTLTSSNHVTSIAFNAQDRAVRVPMHSIPNVAVGKVSNRSAIRLFFPRMYVRESKKIPVEDLESIYNRCLLPTVQYLMPNQATHWPPNYRSAMETSRDRSGQIHLSSLDIPAHLLPEFARLYLERVQSLGPSFRDAYFGHELRGWKGATVHNLGAQDEEENAEAGAIYEHVNALNDLTRVLDMGSIHEDQWLIDIGLEFGCQGKVVTWKKLGHEEIVRFLFPEHENPGRALCRSKAYYVDQQMHIKDLAGFRWTPGSNSDLIHYIQAYTTEKSISYQLHQGIFSFRKPLELVSHRARQKLLSDLVRQSEIIYDCTGDGDQELRSRPQEGCARLEVRVSLADVHTTLINFPEHLMNLTMAQIPASNWWYFKHLRLAAVHTIISNIHETPAKDCVSESILALGAMAIWILNGAHRTPDYRLKALAQQACPEVFVTEDADPDDPDALTSPLMYEAGVYFLCDIVWDSRAHIYRLPYSKTYESDVIPRAYDKGSMQELRHLLGVGELSTVSRRSHAQRTNNRTPNQSIDVASIRPRDRALPSLTHALDGLPIPDPPRPHGPDVDYFHQHGGGNRQLVPPDRDPSPERDPQNPLKNRVRLILEQLYYDIIRESPNRRKSEEGPWTNIPSNLREEHAKEDLYLRLEFPFEAVQYIICTHEEWLKIFNRFFPEKPPSQSYQNFKKARYYSSYLNLVNQLSQATLKQVREELKKKFDSLAWVPHAECDRMWCTRKASSSRWKGIPAGSMQGPKIAISPFSCHHIHGQPKLRPSPNVDEIEEGENSDDGEGV